MARALNPVGGVYVNPLAPKLKVLVLDPESEELAKIGTEVSMPVFIEDEVVPASISDFTVALLSVPFPSIQTSFLEHQMVPVVAS